MLFMQKQLTFVYEKETVRHTQKKGEGTQRNRDREREQHNISLVQMLFRCKNIKCVYIEIQREIFVYVIFSYILHLQVYNKYVQRDKVIVKRELDKEIYLFMLIILLNLIKSFSINIAQANIIHAKNNSHLYMAKQETQIKRDRDRERDRETERVR